MFNVQDDTKTKVNQFYIQPHMNKDLSHEKITILGITMFYELNRFVDPNPAQFFAFQNQCQRQLRTPPYKRRSEFQMNQEFLLFQPDGHCFTLRYK